MQYILCLKSVSLIFIVTELSSDIYIEVVIYLHKHVGV
jgi:hypothetical protein